MSYRCRQKGCPNVYTEVVGGDLAFGSHCTKADCLPCFYAAILIGNGQTPEQVESMPDVMKMFLLHLEQTGWNWNDVKDSYQRKPIIM